MNQKDRSRRVKIPRHLDRMLLFFIVGDTPLVYFALSLVLYRIHRLQQRRVALMKMRGSLDQQSTTASSPRRPSPK